MKKQKALKKSHYQYSVYKYLIFCISGYLLIFILSCTAKKDGTRSKMQPNILIIVADDLGWNDVGYHGSEVRTPTIDKLANEGIEFDKFYVCTACSPTRASLLTGRYPSRLGILTPLGDPAGLPAGTITLAKLLKQKGYDTGISGKWHLGAVPEGRPMNYGFNSSYGYLRGQLDPYTHLYKNGDRTWHRNDQLINEEGHVTDLITKEAIRFIEKPRAKDIPFFLYVAYSVPHYPLDEPGKWVNKYKGQIENKSRRMFAAAVTHMDHSIDLLLSALQKKGMAENTLILFVSDNGGQKSWYSATQYGGKFAAHDVLGNNLPLRDWKLSLYEGGIRVPALLYWPGKVKHQQITKDINIIDIFPTLAQIAGVKIKDEWDIEGINFWPVIEGQKLSGNRLMYWRTDEFIAVKKGEWKLIHLNENPEEGNDELYNVITDPYEEKNIAQQYPEKVKELHKEMVHQVALDLNRE